MTTTHRPISSIAKNIFAQWNNINYAAKPYLCAMLELTTMQDVYGEDSARSIINYFLANANTFRGEHARRLKQELKAILAG